MALQKRLKEQDIVDVMESTQRFEFRYNDGRKLWFWENHWETEKCIKSGISMLELINWLVIFFQEDSFENGQMKVQMDIKKALGIS